MSIWTSFVKIWTVCNYEFNTHFLTFGGSYRFWSKKIFKLHAWVEKCHFGNFSISPKWHFWTHAWNLKFFFGQKHSFEALWKWQLEKIFITCPRVRQIYAGKSTKKGIFLKSPPGNWKNIFVLGSYESLERLEG